MKLNRLIPIALCVMLSVSACKTAKKVDDSADGGVSSQNVEENGLGDSDSSKAMGLKTINFPYDSFALDDQGKATLKDNSQILKDKGSVKIQVEGHCDARGGIQYNIALGEKRANAVKKYLEANGVAASRITTISYGKERLLAMGDSESDHERNRRANFVITSR